MKIIESKTSEFYHIHYDIQDYYLDYKVMQLKYYPDCPPEHQEEYFSGRVKWDGCMDWGSNEGPYQFHFCGRHTANELHSLFMEIYELAEKIPNADLDLF